MPQTFFDIDERERLPLEKLTGHGVAFIRLTHPKASTMELCRGIGEEYGARHCKNLFLTNKHGNSFFLLLMEPDCSYRTSEVSKKLGSTRLSFGTDEQLCGTLGLVSGAVSIMGLVNPEAREAYEAGRLHIAIDSRLLRNERICVHPNVDTATLVVETGELLRFIAELGYEYSTVEMQACTGGQNAV